MNRHFSARDLWSLNDIAIVDGRALALARFKSKPVGCLRGTRVDKQAAGDIAEHCEALRAIYELPENVLLGSYSTEALAAMSTEAKSQLAFAAIFYEEEGQTLLARLLTTVSGGPCKVSALAPYRGVSLLVHALQHNPSILPLLVTHGIDWAAPVAPWGRPPVVHCVVEGKMQFLKSLLAVGAPLQAPLPTRPTALFFSAPPSGMNQKRPVGQQKRLERQAAVVVAAAHERWHMVQALASVSHHQGDVTKAEWSAVLLYLAASNGSRDYTRPHPDTQLAVPTPTGGDGDGATLTFPPLARLADLFALVLRAGADLEANANGQRGMTALRLAVMNSNWPMVKLLLHEGAVIAPCYPEPPLLHVAIRNAANQANSQQARRIARGLVRYGADPYERSKGLDAVEVGNQCLLHSLAPEFQPWSWSLRFLRDLEASQPIAWVPFTSLAFFPSLHRKQIRAVLLLSLPVSTQRSANNHSAFNSSVTTDRQLDATSTLILTPWAELPPELLMMVLSEFLRGAARTCGRMSVTHAQDMGGSMLHADSGDEACPALGGIEPTREGPDIVYE